MKCKSPPNVRTIAINAYHQETVLQFERDVGENNTTRSPTMLEGIYTVNLSSTPLVVTVCIALTNVRHISTQS